MPEVGKPIKRPNIGALVPWAGSARLSAEVIGKSLDGCHFVAVPFAGGLSELPYIKARTLLVNDLHRHVINLATIAADPKLGPMLWRRLRRKPFHPEILAESQACAQSWESGERWLDYSEKDVERKMPELDAAEAYFITQWMGRSGFAGGDKELKGNLALRWNAGGGDSALRYSNAVKGLRDWRKILERCSFSTLHWREVFKKVKDAPKTAIYCDPPWIGLGDKMYKHGFSMGDHVELSQWCKLYKQTRMVVRYGDCDLARKLYPENEGWKWQCYTNRNMGNNDVAEVLIIKNTEST